MPSFISTQQPEIILSAICGPGVAIQSKTLPAYLYVVYTFPAYVYTGFPECVPKTDAKRMAKEMEARAIPPALKNYVNNVFLVRDDDFLKSLWRGSMWPLTCLHSPIKELFSEAGSYLIQQKDKFLSRETVAGWLSIGVHGDEMSALDTSIAWTHAEMALAGRFSAVISPEDSERTLRRVEDKEFAELERERIMAIIQEKREALPQKIKKEDLNEILVGVRGLS